MQYNLDEKQKKPIKKRPKGRADFICHGNQAKNRTNHRLLLRFGDYGNQ
jgi:hypothetical protein